MGLPSINLNLDGGQFSDLFFNFEHPERDKLFKATKHEDTLSEEEVRAALLKDATEFLTVLGIQDQDMAAALVEDFQRRV